jgi:hypothetical protein
MVEEEEKEGDDKVVKKLGLPEHLRRSGRRGSTMSVGGGAVIEEPVKMEGMLTRRRSRIAA